MVAPFKPPLKLLSESDLASDKTMMVFSLLFRYFINSLSQVYSTYSTVRHKFEWIVLILVHDRWKRRTFCDLRLLLTLMSGTHFILVKWTTFRITLKLKGNFNIFRIISVTLNGNHMGKSNINRNEAVFWALFQRQNRARGERERERMKNSIHQLRQFCGNEVQCCKLMVRAWINACFNEEKLHTKKGMLMKIQITYSICNTFNTEILSQMSATCSLPFPFQLITLVKMSMTKCR